ASDFSDFYFDDAVRITPEEFKERMEAAFAAIKNEVDDVIDISRLENGNASLDKAFLEFTREQRRAYIKILRFIAEHEMEKVNVVGEIGWTVCSDGDPYIERS